MCLYHMWKYYVQRIGGIVFKIIKKTFIIKRIKIIEIV